MWKLKLLSCLLLMLGSVKAHQELSDLLNQQQKDLDLSQAEVEALRPFYAELQKQHDYLYSLQLQQSDGGDKLQLEQQLDASYMQAFEHFQAQYVGKESSIVYDTTLPSLEELLEPPSAELSKQQQLELLDLQDILQDVLDESQLGIQQLVKRATELEVQLIKLNKPKIVTAAIAGLQTMWYIWGRASRAAYCSYSHVPQFKEALDSVNGGVDCYKHTMNMILRIQNETVASVKEIKQHVRGLVKVYKKIAAKRTIMGKILTGTLNFFTALRRVHDIIAVGIDGYDKIQNELPQAVLKTKNCAEDLVLSIPQMVETAQNLTICITFVDKDHPDYEFMKPEPQRYWHTGEQPAKIAHENVELDWNAELEAEPEDDYIDHR
ncbi:CG31463 [Drosophila busckii]|uniref:CG31463 n=1 Tax=Drosophila busckii TaxID=30019 RepID=A0A0M4F3K9_DROBS|nr:uncharacterized protein LOC108604161 [Drosophila busckii]ALC46212.1 CG31463 [Drosophila busckii]